MRKLLILCPLPLELDAIISRMHARGHKSTISSAGPVRVYEFSELGWRFALAGHGKTQFGIQTQFLIHHLRPIDAVICTGCAGGLQPNISVFDVIAAQKTIEHDYRLRFIKRPDPEFQNDPQLLAKFQSIEIKEFKIHFGAIASGDEDIVDSKRAQELQLQTGAIAVAWEGAGGARACRFNKIPFLELRGVTDSANSNSTLDFASNLKIAMTNVCDTLLAALT